jgi:L-amino acid N-acyltransferase YncA
MSPLNGLRTRRATVSDAAAIAEIYNQGIADRIATFDTEPRSAKQIAKWFTGLQLVVVAETEETGPVAFAAPFPAATGPATAALVNSWCM